jgi:hypothetical protein
VSDSELPEVAESELQWFPISAHSRDEEPKCPNVGHGHRPVSRPMGLRVSLTSGDMSWRDAVTPVVNRGDTCCRNLVTRSCRLK